jgi:hypothetical protein
MSSSLLNKDYAIYLPAVNDSFAADVLKPLKADRPFPVGIDLKDLIFWDKNNKLWHYSHILHSVGLHKVNSSPNNAVTQAGRTDCFLLGDSAGFQIGTGALKGYDKLTAGMTGNEAVSAWAGAYEVRKWILEWLELHTDYAMTIDMPLWARLDKRSDTPFHNCSIQQLTDMTVENLQFIDANRQGRTNWLNVIQGLDEKTTGDWWAAVKWFYCSGYALAGSAGISGGIKGVLKTVLMIRDDGVLADGRNWIHTLGVSTPKWAILLTAIQRGLRKTVNPKMQISFDSSTPFQEAGIRENLINPPAFTRRPADWSMQFLKMPQSAKLAGSIEPLPNNSPLASKLTLGHLNVRGGAWTQRSFDTVSNLLLCNINCWSMLNAFKQANEIAFASDRKDLPAIWGDCLDFIDDLFAASDWAARLETEKRLLDAMAPAA